MTPLVLRPYQIDAIDRLRNSYAIGRRAPLFQLPTGGGNMQQIGRGMRAAPGKQTLVVLDHVGNIYRHGRLDFERIWTLDGVEKARGTARSDLPRVRSCQSRQCRMVRGVRFRIRPLSPRPASAGTDGWVARRAAIRSPLGRRYSSPRLRRRYRLSHRRQGHRADIK